MFVHVGSTHVNDDVDFSCHQPVFVAYCGSCGTSYMFPVILGTENLQCPECHRNERTSFFE